jgi:hypothetical protein
VADIAVRTLANSGAPAISVDESIIQDKQIAGEALTAGQLVTYATATGNWVKYTAGALGDTGRPYGIVNKSVAAGEAVTVTRKGVIDGYNLDAYTYGKAAYSSATAGAVADATSANAIVIGFVIPVRSQLRGSTPDKLLFVDL